MPSKEFRYVLPPLDESQFPHIPRPSGAKIACIIDPNGGVAVVGNSSGLQYLAKYLAAMSMMTNHNGMHVHLDAETGRVDEGSTPIVIRNLDFGG